MPHPLEVPATTMALGMSAPWLAFPGQKQQRQIGRVFGGLIQAAGDKLVLHAYLRSENAMGFRRKSAQFLPDGRKIGIGLQDDGVVRALHAAPQTAGLADARQDEKIFGTFGQYGFRNRGRRLERL